MTAGRRDGGKAGRTYAGGLVVRAAVLGILLLPALPPSRLPAQSDPRLASAVRLAQEGLGDSARAVTAQLMQSTSPSDTLYPQILYTMAIVAPTATDRQRYLQRITVEYAFSAWADDALLQLTQIEYAAGNAAGAARQAEKLRLDYPSTTLIAQASLWAARAYFDLGKQPEACAWLTDGIAKAGDDIELKNQLTFYSQRCQSVAGAPAPTQTAAQTPKKGKPAPPVKEANPRPAPSTEQAPPTEKATPPESKAVPSPEPTPSPVQAAEPGESVATKAAPESSSAPSAAAPRSPPSSPRSPQPSAAAKKTVWRVQVAAVSPIKSTKTVAVVKSEVAGMGYGVTTLNLPGQGLVKIRVGAFSSREAAQAAVPRIKAKLGGQPFVVSDQ